MLDGLLNRSNFRTKCKSAISRTKTRLEVIKKKRNAVQKFLKKDIADLLKNNLDRNAYGRAEGLYNELNLTSCYAYVGQCCTCISEHLKEMHKQRECPEQCKVAVASLVYAAARFSDLPELRDLRNQFNEKYSISLEQFTSAEFVEKLKANPPTTEMKIQLMQEIAQEFSVTWNSLPWQQQLHAQGLDNPVASRNGASDKILKSRSSVAQIKSKQEDTNKLMNEEQRGNVRTRRHNSYSKLSEDISEILQEQNSIKEESIHSSESDPENNPYKNEETTSKIKDDNILNSRSYDDDLFSKAKPRPRSVRTKHLNMSISSGTSSSENEIDVEEIGSTRDLQATKKGDFTVGEDEMEVFGTKRPLKTPSSAQNARVPTTLEKEDNVTPKSALPPPPGRRRYLFAESQTESPRRESLFRPPDSPTMPNIDELTERVAAFGKT